MRQPFPFRKVYGLPVLLAVVTFGGLLLALLGDGVWNVASWCALSIPLVVIAWKFVQGKRTALRKD